MTACLRGYQEDAVAGIVRALARGGRGQVRAACGTGKTLVALRAAESLVPRRGLIIMLAPTIPLVAQTLAAWEADALVPFDSRAVCSDETVTGAPALAVDDLVSTDPEVIRGWMGGVGRRVIVGTYKSLPALAGAMREAGTTADFLICDEAHRLAGPAGKAAAIALDDSRVPAKRRLFLTATPRLCWSELAPGLSMDDEGLFGPVLYDYPFAQAIADGWLDDYRVAVIGITDEEIRALLDDDGDRDYADTQSGLLLTTMAAQVALVRAVREHGIRRAITFHSRVAAATEFARTLEATIRRIPASMQPGIQVSARHVDGTMNSEQRHRILDTLRDPPYGGWSVASNAKCLTEGIDVPAIDAVLFASPRDSVVDVAQAVGRALRRHHDGTGTATIIVPVVVSGDAETDLESGAFDTVWRVVRAMRAHDETLATSLDFARTNWSRARSGSDTVNEDPLPSRITVSMPGTFGDRLAALLSLAIVQHASSPWWDGYARAAAYQQEHGNLLVPSTYADPDGFNLGHWISHARQDRARGRLPQDRAEALEKLGMAWDGRDARWEEVFMAAAAYREANGDLRVRQDYVTPDGVRLGWWVKTQRYRRDKGLLSEDRCRRLSALGMRWRIRTSRHRGPVTATLTATGDMDSSGQEPTCVPLPGFSALVSAPVRRRPGLRIRRLGF